jgi:hypothetical protein
MKNFKLLFASIMIAAGLSFLAACNTDKCKDVVCQNSGTCLEGVCNCPSGVHGKFCDTLDRAQFIGVFRGSDAC